MSEFGTSQAVVLNGTEHRITVEPGRQGRKHFEREIRRLFNLSRDDELEFTFDCQAPSEAEGACSTLKFWCRHTVGNAI